MSGARATFTRTYEAGDQVALVMAEGPGRGKAGIRVDGKWVMTIDTFASDNTNRIVIFAQGMTAGVHTIAIVNQGTSARPHIDLDAILLGTGSPPNRSSAYVRGPNHVPMLFDPMRLNAARRHLRERVAAPDANQVLVRVLADQQLSLDPETASR